MAKSSNLTVRIDPELKRQAQEASVFLDVSLSQVVSSALRGLIRQSKAHESWLGEFKMPASREIELGGERIAEQAARAAVLDRIAVLQAKERRNELNRVTRAELAALLVKQVTM